MNYKKKIQEIQTKINIINKYYINQVASPSKETTNKLEELTKEHYILLKKYYEKELRYQISYSYILSSNIYLLHINNHYQIHH